jgi:hypothetical protein
MNTTHALPIHAVATIVARFDNRTELHFHDNEVNIHIDSFEVSSSGVYTVNCTHVCGESFIVVLTPDPSREFGFSMRYMFPEYNQWFDG